MLRYDFKSIVGLIIFLSLFLFLILIIIYIFKGAFRFFKQKFDRKDEIAKRRSGGIPIIAGINFLGGLSLLYLFKESLSVPVMGMFIKGQLAAIYYGVIGIVNIYLGVGFLRLQKISWYIWMIEYAFFIASSLLNTFLLSNEKLLNVNIVPVTNQKIFLIMFKGGNIAVMLYCIFLFCYVYSKRNKFSIYFTKR